MYSFSEAKLTSTPVLLASQLVQCLLVQSNRIQTDRTLFSINIMMLEDKSEYVY